MQQEIAAVGVFSQNASLCQLRFATEWDRASRAVLPGGPGTFRRSKRVETVGEDLPLRSQRKPGPYRSPHRWSSHSYRCSARVTPAGGAAVKTRQDSHPARPVAAELSGPSEGSRPAAVLSPVLYTLCDASVMRWRAATHTYKEGIGGGATTADAVPSGR
ncbi:hypothetical protein GN956_G20025 [Arapaima gigas]